MGSCTCEWRIKFKEVYVSVVSSHLLDLGKRIIIYMVPHYHVHFVFLIFVESQEIKFL